MKNTNTSNFTSRVKVWTLLLATFLLFASVSVLAQHDMSNMPGMSKTKPKSKSMTRKKSKALRKKQAAKKHDMANMPGMKMPGMKMPALHRRRAASRRKKAPAQKSPANKNQMGNMPGMNMPAKPSSSPTQSPAPQPSPQQMQTNMPGMQMPQASPSPSPQMQTNMPGMQMPAASPQQKMNMPMPAASPSPSAMSGMTGMKASDDAAKKAGMGDDMSTMNMDPYFTAINYPVPRDTMMVMLLSDFQSARTGNNFFTGMVMVQYGVTSRWTVGFMVEGQKIFGLPTTYGGFRINSYFRVFPHDHLLNFTLYGEYEGLNGAALYKMEVAGFGGEDLNEPLAPARRTPVRTFEQRAIMYHDWGRVNFTFNFINETDLKSGENDFGYAWGVFRQPAFRGMETNKDMAGTAGMPKKKAPPALSLQRLGYGVEMIGALGNAHHFGFDWHRQQQYVGPVFSYSVSKNWTVHVEPAFGLSDVSDPFVLRMGVGYSIDHLLHRRSPTP